MIARLTEAIFDAVFVTIDHPVHPTGMQLALYLGYTFVSPVDIFHLGQWVNTRLMSFCLALKLAADC